MKRLKKLLLIMMCVGILVSVTACAGNSNDNGAGQNDVVNDNGANDTQTGDSAMDKIGDGLEDGIDDVGKGVGDVVDDLDGDGRSDNRENTNNNTGHRGGNHPVKDLSTGRVYISSQNHGYAVDYDTMDKEIAEEAFVNVNDGTNEGLNYIGKKIYTVQFHPEACPGPQDSTFLFDRFIEMMKGDN